MFGAKLGNPFPTKSDVKSADKDAKKSSGTNMSETTEPKIKELSGTESTRVVLDSERFETETLDDDTFFPPSRKTYDIATKGVKVFLNGQRSSVKSFKESTHQSERGTGKQKAEQEKNTATKITTKKANHQMMVIPAKATKAPTPIRRYSRKTSQSQGDKSVKPVPSLITRHLWQSVTTAAPMAVVPAGAGAVLSY